MRMSDWSSVVCSSDLNRAFGVAVVIFVAIDVFVGLVRDHVGLMMNAGLAVFADDEEGEGRGFLVFGEDCRSILDAAQFGFEFAIPLFLVLGDAVITLVSGFGDGVDRKSTRLNSSH